MTCLWPRAFDRVAGGSAPTGVLGRVIPLNSRFGAPPLAKLSKFSSKKSNPRNIDQSESEPDDMDSRSDPNAFERVFFSPMILFGFYLVENEAKLVDKSKLLYTTATQAVARLGPETPV